MDAEILAVGTELLMGQITNTNAQHISAKLPDAGVNVYYHSVVGDNPKRLEACLRLALSRSGAVIVTGGLGPTQDDLTKETVAAVLGKRLVPHEESLQRIRGFFEKLGRPMVDSNLKQGYMPEDCIVLRNDRGTAPGCIIEAGGKVVVLLPGPPSEMGPMFDTLVMDYFKERSEYKIVSKHLRIFGIGESAVEEKLIDLVEGQSNPTIAPYAKEGEVTLRVTARCRREEDPEPMLEDKVAQIRERIGDCLYSTDDSTLDEVAAKLLQKTGTTIAIAESCTGGLVSERLTAIPGISQVFDRGLVTYSNMAKMEELGVEHATLDRHGAVSAETVTEMATGVRRAAGTALGIAVTGIAGPDGGTPEKPVGLVYIALAHAGGVEYKKLNLWGNRNRIRNTAALHVFDMIRRHLLF